MAFLYELQSQLETMQDEQRQGKQVKEEHLRIIHNNLPVITEYCGMKPYDGDDSYTALNDYMKKAEKILAKRSNEYTLRGDALMAGLLRQQGKESVLQLKRDNYNQKLEDCVLGADQRRMVDIVDECLVPRTGIIFLTPSNHMGRAPFYSSEKIVGSWHVKTLWFNMAVMALMCVIMAILLFADCPGRYIRKGEQ